MDDVDHVVIVPFTLPGRLHTKLWTNRLGDKVVCKLHTISRLGSAVALALIV